MTIYQESILKFYFHFYFSKRWCLLNREKKFFLVIYWIRIEDRLFVYFGSLTLFVLETPAMNWPSPLTEFFHFEFEPCALSNIYCRKNRNNFLHSLLILDLKPITNSPDDKVCVIISLMQTEQVRRRFQNQGRFSLANEPVNFSVCRIIDDGGGGGGSLRTGSSTVQFGAERLAEVFSKPTYSNVREINERLELAPGAYIIIPSLFYAGVEARFMLRVFCEIRLADEEAQSITGYLRSEKARLRIGSCAMEENSTNNLKSSSSSNLYQQSASAYNLNPNALLETTRTQRANKVTTKACLIM